MRLAYTRLTKKMSSLRLLARVKSCVSARFSKMPSYEKEQYI